jgi:ABC-2 type transport system permease protein
MSPTVAYVKAEVRRTLRNRRTLMFGLLLPVLFLLIAGSDEKTLDGLDVAPFFMMSMATFGAMSAIFTSSGRVSTDRSTGWNRQLRLTALSGRGYLTGKLLTGFIAALPSILVIFLLSAFKNHVHLTAEEWIGSAAAILVALIPIGIFGIAVGYLGRPDNMQAIAGALFSLLSILGGIWYPISSMPGWLQAVAKALPMSWGAAAGRDVLLHTWIGFEGAGVLLAWTVGLGALAAWAYRRDALRV